MTNTNKIDIISIMKVAIIGHTEFEITDKLKELLKSMLNRLIENGTDTFYFCGTKDYFDKFCYEIIGNLKQSREVKRVLARAYYECISIEEDIFKRILEFTENRTFYDNLHSKISSIYIRPFNDIIDLSDVFLTYFKEKDDPPSKFIGKAVKYAKIKKKKIINIFELL